MRFPKTEPPPGGFFAGDHHDTKPNHLLGMTYQELAEQSGYSFATIDAYTKGSRKPSEKLLGFLEGRIRDRLTAGDKALCFLKSVLEEE